MGHYLYVGLTVSIFLLCCSMSVAQSRLVTGRITSVDKAIGQVLITDVTTKVSSLSDTAGRYVIQSAAGNRLMFSKLGYLTDTLNVTVASTLNVILKQKNINLMPVVVKANRINATDIYKRTQQEYHSIYRVGNNHNMIRAGAGGIAVGIDPLYSNFSKNGKNARRLQRAIESDYKIKATNERFPIVLIKKVLQCSDSTASAFAKTHQPPLEWLEKASQYEIISYIKERRSGLDSVKSQKDIR